MRRAPRALLIAAIAVAGASLLPVVYLSIRAPGGFGVLTQGRTAELLATTVALVAAVTASTVALGVTAAWLTERTDLPGARVWTVLLALPLAIPTYVGAYVALSALGARGLLTGWLGLDRLPTLSGFGGSWVVLTVFTYPYVFLTVRAGLRGLDPALEEAARGLGAGPARAFRRVVLPQLRPSIVAGGLLVALYTLHDFGAVSLLRTDTFTRAIFLQYNAAFDRSRAAVLGLILVALTVVVLRAEAAGRARGALYRARIARAAPRAPLRVWRAPALAFVGTLTTLGVLIPAAVIAAWLARAPAASTETLAAAVNSARVAALAALVALVAAWPVVWLTARYPSGAARTIERASYIGFSLPGLVVALALVFFAARVTPVVYQTTTLLVFAYVVLFVSHAIGPLRARALQLHPSLEEAAAGLGASPAQRLRQVVAPLMRPGTLAALALVFLTTMKELPATLLLAPTGFDTLATEVWSATNAASFARAALPALGLIMISSGPLALLLTRRSATP